MKKNFTALIAGILIFLNISIAANATAHNNLQLDTAKLESGTFSVSYHKNNSNSKLKVMVEKEGVRLTYDLKNNGIEEKFPLQLGNGEYSISVLENIEGTKYKYLTKEKIFLMLEDERTVYLASVQNVNWDSEMLAIKKANALTKGLKTDAQKIKAIYEYVIGSIKYDYEKIALLSSGYTPDINHTVTDQKGICYDYSSVFAAMLRSQGIPAKLIKGYTDNAKGYHAWNEVYNSATGKWMVIDTTYDAQMKSAGAKYQMEKNAALYDMQSEF